MNDIILIIKKEWSAFVKSDKAIFLIYGFLIIAWSFLLSANMNTFVSEGGTLWLVFFSVIVSGNFANTVFVSERMSGSLEILLISGLSRSSILFGKMLFVIIMSVIMGFLCYAFALVISGFYGADIRLILSVVHIWRRIILYCAACFMNAASGAWLSVRISNPRFIHFINLFVLVLVVAIHSVLALFLPVPSWLLAAVLFFIGTVLTIFAYRNYKSEKVIQPLVY